MARSPFQGTFQSGAHPTITMSPDVRVCTKCGIPKPLSDFYQYKTNSSGGYRKWCKKCYCEHSKVYRDTHAESAGQKEKRKQRDRDRAKTPERKAANNARMKSRPVEIQILDKARQRAKDNELPFDLTIEDILIPAVCPLLGVEIRRSDTGKGHCSTSPTLDRLDPLKGYVKDNVWVVSWRANRLKSDATLEELKLLVKNLEGKINGS